MNITLNKYWFEYDKKDISSNKLKYKGNGINYVSQNYFPRDLRHAHKQNRISRVE